MKTSQLIATLATLLAATAASAIDLSKYTVDGGGSVSTGGGFVLSGTTGQPDAGYASGGGFDLSGGFWTANPTPAACPGDADDNGVVDLTDLSIVLSEFGMAGPGLAGDINGDNVVDLSDLSEVLANFGAAC